MAVIQNIELLNVAASDKSVMFKVLLNGEEKVFIGKQNKSFSIPAKDTYSGNNIASSAKLAAPLRTLDSFQKSYQIDKAVITNDEKKKDIIVPAVVSQDIFQFGNYLFSMSKPTNNTVLYLLYKNRLVNRYVDESNNLTYYTFSENIITKAGNQPENILAYIRENFTLEENDYMPVESKENYSNLEGYDVFKDKLVVSKKVDQMPFNMIFEYDNDYQYTAEESQIFVNFFQLKNHLSPFFNVSVNDENQFVMWRDFKKIDCNLDKIWMSYSFETPQTITETQTNNAPITIDSRKALFGSGNLISNIDNKFDNFKNGLSIHLQLNRDQFFRRAYWAYKNRQTIEKNDKSDIIKAWENGTLSGMPANANRDINSSAAQKFFGISSGMQYKLYDWNTYATTEDIANQMVSNNTGYMYKKYHEWGNSSSGEGYSELPKSKTYFLVDYNSYNNDLILEVHSPKDDDGIEKESTWTSYESSITNWPQMDPLLDRNTIFGPYGATYSTDPSISIIEQGKDSTIGASEDNLHTFCPYNQGYLSYFIPGKERDAELPPLKDDDTTETVGFRHTLTTSSNPERINIYSDGNDTSYFYACRYNKYLSGECKTPFRFDSFLWGSSYTEPGYKNYTGNGYGWHQNDFTTLIAYSTCKNFTHRFQLYTSNSVKTCITNALYYFSGFKTGTEPEPEYSNAPTNILSKDTKDYCKIHELLDYINHGTEGKNRKYIVEALFALWLMDSTNITFVGSDEENKKPITSTTGNSITEVDNRTKTFITAWFKRYSDQYSDDKGNIPHTRLRAFTPSACCYKLNNIKYENRLSLEGIQSSEDIRTVIKNVINFEESQNDNLLFFTFKDMLAAYEYYIGQYNYWKTGDKLILRNARITAPYGTSTGKLSEKYNDDTETKDTSYSTQHSTLSPYALSKLIEVNQKTSRAYYQRIFDIFDGNKETNQLFDIFGSRLNGVWSPNFRKVEAELAKKIFNTTGDTVSLDLTIDTKDEHGYEKLIIKSYLNGELLVKQVFEPDSETYKNLYQRIIDLKTSNLYYYSYGSGSHIGDMKYNNISIWNYPIPESTIKSLHQNALNNIPLTNVGTAMYNINRYNEYTQTTTYSSELGTVGKLVSQDSTIANISYIFANNDTNEQDKLLYKVQDFEFIDKLYGVHKLNINEGRKSNLYSIRIKNTGLSENPYSEMPDSQEYKDYEHYRLTCIKTLESTVQAIATKAEPLNAKLFSLILED